MIRVVNVRRDSNPQFVIIEIVVPNTPEPERTIIRTRCRIDRPATVARLAAAFRVLACRPYNAV